MPSHGVLVSFGARRFPKGNEGKRVSSGYNRRRRLATRSSGKQQAERTAVRAAPIVCPEESPLVRPQAHTPRPRWGLTRRLRRGKRAGRPMGRSIVRVAIRRGLGASGKPPVRPQAHTPALPPAGPDAPTAAREWDLQSQGAFILFFRWRKKSVQKKASGTATPGKRLLLPILTAGLAMSRAMELDSYHTGAERARARLFPPSK